MSASRRPRPRFMGPSWTHRGWVAAAVVLALGGGARPASAQGVAPTLAGIGAGAAVGGLAAAALVVARARLSEDYLQSSSDVFGWPLATMVTGSVSGALIGAHDGEALRDAALLAGLSGALGAGVGALIGRASSVERNPWAGAVLGAGLGAVTGWVVGAIHGGDAVTARPAASWVVRVALGRIP